MARRAASHPKIEFLWEHECTEAYGGEDGALGALCCGLVWCYAMGMVCAVLCCAVVLRCDACCCGRAASALPRLALLGMPSLLAPLLLCSPVFPLSSPGCSHARHSRVQPASRSAATARERSQTCLCLASSLPSVSLAGCLEGLRWAADRAAIAASVVLLLPEVQRHHQS